MSLASSTSSAAAGAPDKVDEYMKSRVVHAGSPVAVLVDAFRHTRECLARLEAKWGAASSSDGCASACEASGIYFLSHFHSDHYTGLTASNAGACGVIYASRPTAALMVSQLGVPQAHVFPLDFGPRYCFSLLDGAFVGQSGGDADDTPVLLPPGLLEKNAFYVRLIPANHCPGAAMLLFTSPVFGTLLHTGDFRFNGGEEQWRRAARRERHFAPKLISRGQGGEGAAGAALPAAPSYECFIEDDAALRRVAGRVDTLFLDNTFCSPDFKFISQWEATQGVVATLQQLMRSRSPPCEGGANRGGGGVDATVRCVLLIGTYTIGKERVAFAVQEAFPSVAEQSGEGGAGRRPMAVPVHVSCAKYHMMRDMNYHADRFSPLSSDEAPTGRSSEAGLSEVQPPSCRVELPEITDINTGDGSDMTVNRSLLNEMDRTDSPEGSGSHSDSKGGRTTFLLTIVLVPLGSVRYPPIAAAVGRPLQRDSAELPAGPPLLDIGDGLGLNLARYDCVLAVEPTGWAKRPAARYVSETTWLYKVPYSEHCAFPELLSFVGFVNPRRVVPTVSAEQYKQHEPLFVERAPRLSSRHANTQPLSRFFPIVPRKRAAPATTAGEGAAHVTGADVSSIESKSRNPFAPKPPGLVNSLQALPGSQQHVAQETPAVFANNNANAVGRTDASFSVKREREPSVCDGCLVVGIKHAVFEISDDDD